MPCSLPRAAGQAGPHPQPQHRQYAAFKPFQQATRPTCAQSRQHTSALSRRNTVVLTAGAGGVLWVAGGVVAAAGAAAAAAGLMGGDNPQALVRTGMQKFRQVL